jgi:NAD(P) transhydrogenase
MKANYDLAVIGAGPAGQAAAELAVHLGRRVIIVERNQPGGTVTTTGGAPTKTLREAALALTGFGQDEVYGIRAAVPLDTALPIIAARTRAVVDCLQQAVADQIAGQGIDYLHGEARMVSGGAVLVTLPDGARRELSARAVLIASGSRPAHPTGVPFDDPDVYDTDRIYSIQKVPHDITIVGGGPVGVEFATIFTALGIPATLIDHSERLLPAMDGELAGLMGETFARYGVKQILGTGVTAVARVDGRLTVTLSSGDIVATDAVLFGAGRTPNTGGLGLEEAGVQLDARGRIVVDRYFQTTAPGIYAAGDVVGLGLASMAKQQGRAAASRAFGLVFGVALDRTASSAVYGVQEVAGVGMTEEQAVAANVPYVVGRCDLAATARGAIAGHGGLLKLIFRADDRTLLGVHCIGEVASEIIGLGHVVLHTGGAVELFLTLALNMPTYSAAYHDAAIDGLTRLAETMGLPLASGIERSERDERSGGIPTRRRRRAASTPYTEMVVRTVNSDHLCARA